MVMGPFISLFLVLLRLGLGGILIPLLGVGLDCLYSAIWLDLCSIFVLQFLTPGRTKLQLISVAVKVSGWPLVGYSWIFTAS